MVMMQNLTAMTTSVLKRDARKNKKIPMLTQLSLEAAQL
jgi:hypothetical protein